jgi:Spy/CpxP family protein refolding chaperone
MRAITLSAFLLSCCCLLLSARALASSPDDIQLPEEMLAQLPPPPFGFGADCPGPMLFQGLDECHDFPPGLSNSTFLSAGPVSVRMPHGAPLMMLLPPDLELTDDQVDKLSQLKRGIRNKTSPIVAKISSLEHSRSLALDEENLNPSEISKQSAEINAQKQLLDGILTDARIQMAQVLTAEQRHKIRLFAERRELGPLGLKKPPTVPAIQQ